MKKILTLMTIAIFNMAPVFAQNQHDQSHNCRNCPHHQKHQKQSSQQKQQPTVNADGIQIEIVKAFPTVKSVKKDKKYTEVYNAKKQLIGYAVYSKPASDGIKGFSGETPIMIAMDTKKVITGVWLLQNNETPAYVQKVENSGYLKNWNGLTIKQANKKKVDAVSGATFTSKAVAESVQAALKTL